MTIEELAEQIQTLNHKLDEEIEIRKNFENNISILQEDVRVCKSEILNLERRELEAIKIQLQTTVTEFGATKSQLQSFDAALTKGLAELQSIKQGLLAPGTEILREVHPLALTSNDGFIDVNGNWRELTLTVYSTYDYTTTLAGTQRKYKLVIRQGNDGQAPRGDISKYRLFYPWVRNADNIEYPGILDWGNLDEGGWDTITLNHIANPFNTDKSGNNYWRLEGFTSNCTNRVFNITLLIFDMIT